MLRLKDRARGAVAGLTVVAGSMLLGACDVKQELLSPQQPACELQPGVNVREVLWHERWRIVERNP